MLYNNLIWHSICYFSILFLISYEQGTYKKNLSKYKLRVTKHRLMEEQNLSCELSLLGSYSWSSLWHMRLVCQSSTWVHIVYPTTKESSWFYVWDIIRPTLILKVDFSISLVDSIGFNWLLEVFRFSFRWR